MGFRGSAAMDAMFVSLSESSAEALTPTAMASGDGVFGRGLGLDKETTNHPKQ